MPHEARGHEAPDTGRGVFALIEDLLSQVAKFLDQRLMLLRLEVEDSLGALMRHLAVLLIGGALAGLGLVLSSIALALWIGSQVGSAVAGYAMTGATFVLVGAVLVTIRLHRGIGPQRPPEVPALKELERHARWLKTDI